MCILSRDYPRLPIELQLARDLLYGYFTKSTMSSSETAQDPLLGLRFYGCRVNNALFRLLSPLSSRFADGSLTDRFSGHKTEQS